MTRAEVFAELRRQNVASVKVEFSGGGDEGGVDNISLLDDQGNVIRELDEWYGVSRWNSSTKQWEDAPPPTADEALSKALSRPVYGKYGSFAGEFSVHGVVIWDVTKESVTMNGRETVEEYESFDEEV